MKEAPESSVQSGQSLAPLQHLYSRVGRDLNRFGGRITVGVRRRKQVEITVSVYGVADSLGGRLVHRSDEDDKFRQTLADDDDPVIVKKGQRSNSSMLTQAAHDERQFTFLVVTQAVEVAERANRITKAAPSDVLLSQLFDRVTHESSRFRDVEYEVDALSPLDKREYIGDCHITQ
ncbi:hypothetical protein QDR78_02720 [Mycobacterium marinum]|uniref:hypothetical protein n=1 Tax=Mycobacterium marinum TaxID=1781 RepID=UPI000CD9C835|nr:hypothetical protein [Mycobacterium marinum]WOR05182.1 hypothetical protein QDR78_02720 [Mycobacterium marinum]